MMTQSGMDSLNLQGERVAFAGRLASMTLAEAAALVRKQGGEWVRSVTARTTMLVVGQDGWPLQPDGRLTYNLREARRHLRIEPIAILSEADWLGRLGSTLPISAVLSTPQLSQVLRISGKRIREWVRLGLIRPATSPLGVHYFDFRQVSWAKTLCRLVNARVSASRIRKSLRQLKGWVPGVEEPLAQLAMLEQDGQLLIRLEGQPLAEASGQGLFDFSDEHSGSTVKLEQVPRTAGEWFSLAYEHEQADRLAEAADAYRNALAIGGPDAETCFNLANVLHAQGRSEGARERYREALEIDPHFAEAWLNLGNVLAEVNQLERALEAYRKVLELDSQHADALYNLADTLDQLRRQSEALPHWKAYLHHDSASAWAAYARRRIASATNS
jgi:tetratricopeptide (TPR) repeat protein